MKRYQKVTIEAAVSGWVLKVIGKPAEVFVRWERLIERLELELTSKGDNYLGEINNEESER